MKIKIPIVLATGLLCGAALLPLLSSQTSSSDTVAAITKLENDQTKAALANDISYTKTYFADDAIEGTSFGEWLTKASLLADGADTAKNKTNSMTVTDLKVTAHGNVAIARYLNTYDDVYHGTHAAAQ
jgi:ketosteroid isomerase-like protein